MGGDWSVGRGHAAADLNANSLAIAIIEFSNKMKRSKRSCISLSPIRSRRGFFSIKSRVESPSPVRDEEGASFKRLPKFAPYMQMHRLKLSHEKQEQIQYLLDVECKAKEGYIERLKDKNYFIDYNHNPFMDVPSKRIKANYSKSKSNRGQASEPRASLVDAHQQLRNRDTCQ